MSQQVLKLKKKSKTDFIFGFLDEKSIATSHLNYFEFYRLLSLVNYILGQLAKVPYEVREARVLTSDSVSREHMD